MQSTQRSGTELYPLLFTPAYAERIWGGHLLKDKLGRILPEGKLPMGEAWEIYDRPMGSSVVENGPLKGKNLHWLMKEFRGPLLGNNSGCTVIGGKEYFPLLVKLLDSAQTLSLQVHPSASDCLAMGRGDEKNELWYIIHAERSARIFAGLSPFVSKTQFLDALESGGDLEELLQSFDACPGDAYFIHAGRLHAVGAGVLLLEIQQNSDTTYRVSDWGRTAPDGTRRTLHIAEAMRCIDFADRAVARITGPSDFSSHNRKYAILEECRYFQVTDLKLVEEIYQNTESTNTFRLVTSIDHAVKVECSSGDVLIPAGRTCLIPACTGRYKIVPQLEKEGETADVILTAR